MLNCNVVKPLHIRTEENSVQDENDIINNTKILNMTCVYDL